MALNRIQIKDFVRVYVREIDQLELQDEVLNTWINFGLRQIQQDLISIGLDYYTTMGIYDDSIIPLPPNAINTNNAIIDVKASNGTRAIWSVAPGTGTISTSFIETGASGGWLISLENGAPNVSITVNVAGKSVSIKYKTASSTNQDVVDALNNSLTFRRFFTQATTTNGAALVTATQVLFSVTEGTGGVLTKAKELSIEEYNERQDSTYEAPSETNYQFVKYTTVAGNRVIEFAPATVKHSVVWYYYQLSDLVSDQSVTGLPAEYEQMIVYYVASKILEMIIKTATPEQKIQYEQRLKGMQLSYEEMLGRKDRDIKKKQELTSD